MSGGKETPRQKMIGMMYLFYTALLALNISSDILNAFILVNDSMVQTNENFGSKNELIISAFENQLSVNEKKVRPFYDKAMKAEEYSAELVDYLNWLNDTLVVATEFDGDPTKTENIEYVLEAKDGSDSIVVYPKPHDIPVIRLKKKDKYNVPQQILIPTVPGMTKQADVMKEKFAEYNKNILSLLSKEDQKDIKLGLKTNRAYNAQEKKWEEWEHNTFHHGVLVADIVIINKYISEVLNTEAEVIAKLYSYIDAKSIKFDKVRAAVIPTTTVVISGDDYEADIFVAAYSETEIPIVSYKTGVDTVLSADLKTGEMTVIDKSNTNKGITKLTIPTSSTGDFKYAGFIQVKGPDGKYKPYPFNQAYQVIKPSGTVSPTKMNVVYIGLDNPMSYSASGFTMAELSVSASGGSIKGRKNGEFIFVPAQGKREAVISITGKKAGGESVNLGRYKFRIKGVPAASPEVKGKKNLETIVSSTIRANSKVKVEVLLKNFPFDLSYRVIKYSYRLQSPKGGVLASGKSTSEIMPKKLTVAISKAPRNSMLTVMGIYYVDKKRPSMKPKLASNLALNIR